MAIVFKKALRKNVADQTAAAKYYPQLLTLGQSVGIDKIAYQMKENSSLSKGDILSVIANFVECMRKNLYNGHSVNIRDFGVFSLSRVPRARKRRRTVRQRRYGQCASTSALRPACAPIWPLHAPKTQWSSWICKPT